jgi:hypothetical protein
MSTENMKVWEDGKRLISAGTANRSNPKIWRSKVFRPEIVQTDKGETFTVWSHGGQDASVLGEFATLFEAKHFVERHPWLLRVPSGVTSKGKWHVGKRYDGVREAFQATRQPTQATHGSKYKLAEGPFRTKAGAVEFARIWNAGGTVTQEQAEHGSRSRVSGR